MFNGVFGIANGTVLVVVVVVVAVGVDVVVVVVVSVPGATVANGSNVPELFDGGGGDAAGGMLFNGLNGSPDAAVLDGAAGGVPGLFCAPGAGGKFNGEGSTATGLGGDGGGEAKVEFAKIMADKNAAATDRER